MGFQCPHIIKDIWQVQSVDGAGNKDTLVQDASLGDLRASTLTQIPLPPPTGSWTLYVNDNSMVDLWLAVTWGKGD